MENKFKTNTILGFMSKFGCRAKLVLIGGLILLPILSILVTVFYSYETIEDVRKESQAVIDRMNENRYDLLTATITENYKKAKMQTEYVKENIVEELGHEYGDNKNRMKEDYLSHDIDNAFYRVLSSNISNKFINNDTDGNRMFIATRHGILLDNSLRYSNNSFKDWLLIIETSGYKELIQNSLHQIRSQEDKIILWIDEANNEGSSVGIDSNDINKPVSQFIHDRLVQCTDDLDSFSIITASYIFDHEDIFGVPDVLGGKFTNNDKLYIIQVINIGDMLDSNKELQKSIQDYQATVEMQEEFVNSTIQYRTLITILVVLLEITTFFGICYLAEFYVYTKSKQSS